MIRDATAAGTRSTTLNRAAFGLGQLAGFGLGKPDELAVALLEAMRHAGLPDSEACATIAMACRPARCRCGRRPSRPSGASSWPPAAR